MRSRIPRAVAVFSAVGALALVGCSSSGSGSDNQSPSAGGSGSVSSTTGSPTPSTTPTSALKPVLPAGDGKAKCSGVDLAYIGTINGGSAALGIAIKNAAQLAIEQHNKANPGCQVGFKQYDSEGSGDKAPGVVTQAINTKSIIGVVGLPFSTESKATGKAFDTAGLVHITPSATNPLLTKNGWKTFFRALGNDAVQGPLVAKLLTEKLGAKKVFVVEDDSDYGKGLSKTAQDGLGDKVAGTDAVKTGQTDFDSTVNKIVAASPDAVFYSGYYPEAGPFVQQLRQGGFTGKIVTPDGVKDPEFIKGAGKAAAEGSYFTCPCVPGENITDFAKAYKDRWKVDPQTYSPESYDAATILLSGIDKGNTTRPKLLDWVTKYDADGITKHYKFESDGEPSGSLPVWSYVVKNGEIVPFEKLQ